MSPGPGIIGADALVPASLSTLLGWALEGLARDRSVFGLPKRSFWIGAGARDISVAVPGGRITTPLGIAAGPHTQLAHNIVVGWLAGARLLELKTVQILDRLEIPRPCIDAPGEGYNTEWSQELRLEESLEQYVAAWCLVHTLAPHVLGESAGNAELAGTRFDASVGYDLTGIRSEPVARFLDGLTDAAPSLARLRDALPPHLRSRWPQAMSARVVDTVTLSSFHGCPADEIEQIVEHLFTRHAVNVVVKLNPTLLGFDEVDALLHGPLGWKHVVLDPGAFERDLKWDHAIDLLERLRGTAKRVGRTLGVKLTNTLVVRNTRERLRGEAVYLSGAPLHPIAMRLAERLTRATGGAIPLSLSAGVDADNFADAVACGFAPVTTCTDLLRPTGYRRLPRYLKALTAEMERCDVTTVGAYIAARAAALADPLAGPGSPALANLAAYAASTRANPRYAAGPSQAPLSTRPPLQLVDCDSCNQCTLACPNGAFFDVPSPRDAIASTQERQWVLLADFCNACGNCETFCPQSGGPYRVKARFHTSRAAWDKDTSAQAVLIEAGGHRIITRYEGHEVALERLGGSWQAPDGPAAPALSWLGLLAEQALREVNPLSAKQAT